MHNLDQNAENLQKKDMYMSLSVTILHDMATYIAKMSVSCFETSLMHACMYVYMYVCMYVCMHVCMCVCMYLYVWMHACMHACVYVYACIYVCMYVCIYQCIHACMYVCMHACMYARTYVRMYLCLYVCINVWALPHASRQVGKYARLPTDACMRAHACTHMTHKHTRRGSRAKLDGERDDASAWTASCALRRAKYACNLDEADDEKPSHECVCVYVCVLSVCCVCVRACGCAWRVCACIMHASCIMHHASCVPCLLAAMWNPWRHLCETFCKHWFDIWHTHVCGT
jgi:hypothetical protein